MTRKRLQSKQELYHFSHKNAKSAQCSAFIPRVAKLAGWAGPHGSKTHASLNVRDSVLRTQKHLRARHARKAGRHAGRARAQHRAAATPSSASPRGQQRGESHGPSVAGATKPDGRPLVSVFHGSPSPLRPTTRQIPKLHPIFSVFVLFVFLFAKLRIRHPKRTACPTKKQRFWSERANKLETTNIPSQPSTSAAPHDDAVPICAKTNQDRGGKARC